MEKEMWYFNIVNLTGDPKARFTFSAIDTYNLSTNRKKICFHMKLAGSEVKFLPKIFQKYCLQENIKEKEKRNNLREVWKWIGCFVFDSSRFLLNWTECV